MRVVYEKQFRSALKDIVEYIKEDKVSASKLFKKELKEKFELVKENPKMYRASIYHKNEAYRDLVFMGYTAIYKIEDDVIKVLDIFKWVDK
ncbi:MAG TPA: type II toxin-antitoxin system RelE/ParE family toxin [Epsilonproteobacteria bacterium]|nr:type II toxin-antitoxin system RelE/ParE family toxin [Campylobacterota bacterium]